MKVYLKVKIKSLAAEAKIIRREENKAKVRSKTSKDEARRAKFREGWLGLKGHRRADVRKEARVSQLAYGFLRGRDYVAMEADTHERPDFSRVELLANRYGEDDPRERAQRFAEWKHEAMAHILASENTKRTAATVA